MGTESVGSSGSSSNYSALAALWAQQQAAAAEAARRAAEAARRAAEEARRKAEEAARVAAEARRKADEQRRAAEAAEAQAERSSKKTDIDNAAQQRELAKAAEAEAVKQEAVAHLRDKEATLSESKAQDAEQGRAANAPSEGTRAAQAEVAAATETARIYEKGPVPETKQKDAALKAASDNTQTKLTAAEKAVNVINEAHENGHEASDAEVKASVAAVNDWLDASQHEMRLVGLSAQADGKDSQAAVKAKAEQATKSLDGDVFDTKKLTEFIDKGRDQVLGESGAMRQVRSEQYTAQQSGEAQLADARKNQPGLEAAADAAEKTAQGFNGTPAPASPAGAENAAQQDALEKRAAADAGKHQIEGLSLAYEGSTDEKTGRYTPGSVSADYEARAADIEVKENNDEYQRLNNNGIGGQALTDAGNKLDASLANQRLAHADRDVANTQLERADTRVERDAAQANADVVQGDATNTLFGNSGGNLYLNGGNFNNGTPGLSTNFNNGGSLLLPTAGSTGNPTYVPLSIDGTKPFTAPGSNHQVGTPFTAGQLGQTAQGANTKYNAADQKAKDAAAAQDQAYNDLIGDPGKKAPALDTTAWLGREKEITDTLDKAHTGVTEAQDKLHLVQGTGKDADNIKQAQLDLGKAKEAEITAQADADTLKAMRDVRDAQRREANGEKISAEDMSKLRAAARDKLKASMEAGPTLTPENEAKAREDLKTKQDALKAQDAEVKGAFTAYDRAYGTKDEAAAAKTLKDAQDKRTPLDSQVRNLQTLLDQIDTNRLTLAADQEYKTHNFAKPEKRMTDADENGNTTEYTWLPKDYNATNTILPDASGKPKADGLPPGLKPENVEVKKEDGKWKVHFKEDSDHIGYIDGEKFYEIEEGDTIEMDAATAAVWEAHSHSDAATKARGDYEQEMTDIGVPAPAVAPGGERPLNLSFAEDLGARRLEVNKQISDYTKSTRHDPGAGPEPDDIKLARLELHAIDLAIDWKEADQVRQGQDAAVRGGLKSNPEGKSPQEIADDKREAAKQARQEWINESNKLGLDKAKDDQKTKQDAHDKWKKAHPYLLGSERDSTTWKDLQAANGDVDQAQRRKVAGANVQADIDNKKFIADHLSADKMNDPAALYDLFMENPQVMAQSIINQHYMAYGSQPMQMLGRTHLSNEVGIALGWTTDVGLDPNAPEDSKRLREGVDLFTKLNKDQKETHDAAVKSIVDIGGEDARVTVLPVVYGMPGENGGIVKTALFKVEQKNGGDAKFVDDKGRQYDSVRDFRANNQLPVEGVNLAMPEDGNVTLDDKGNVKLFTGDARTETGWETFRRKTNLDVIVGVAGLVAGVVLAVGSLGTLTAPAALLMAASITTLAASAYGVVTSAENLVNEAQHGVDINPLTNRAARMDWLNGALSLAAVPGAGSAAKASTLAWRAANAGRAAEKAGTQALQDAKLARQTAFKDAAANVWQPGKNVQRGLMAGNVGATEENVRYMADNWANMSPADRKHQIGMLGLSLAGFASHPLAKVYNAGHQGVKSFYNNTVKGGGRSPSPGDGGAPMPPDGGGTPQQPDGTQAPHGDGDTTVQNTSYHGDDGSGAPEGPGSSPKALDPYRESTVVRPEEPTHTQGPAASPKKAAETPSEAPDNVRPLHPDGPPVVPEPVGEAPLAPVISLAQRAAAKAMDPLDPNSPTAAAANPESQPEMQVLRLAAGAENQHYEGTNTPPPQSRRNGLYAVNAGGNGHTGTVQNSVTGGTPPVGPTGSNAGGGSSPGGTPSSGTPTGGNPAGGTPASGTPTGGAPASGTPTSGTPIGGTPAGGTPTGAGTPPVAASHGTSSTAGPSPAAGSNAGTAGFDANGLPQAPRAGRGRSWAEVASRAEKLLAAFHLGTLKPSRTETALFNAVSAEPPAGAATQFAVSQADAVQAMYVKNNAGVDLRNSLVYSSFAEAQSAAKDLGGAWIHRIEPDSSMAPLGGRDTALSHEVQGSIRVNGDGTALPIAIPNTDPVAWGLPRTASAQPAAVPATTAHPATVPATAAHPAAVPAVPQPGKPTVNVVGLDGSGLPIKPTGIVGEDNWVDARAKAPDMVKQHLDSGRRRSTKPQLDVSESDAIVTTLVTNAGGHGGERRYLVVDVEPANGLDGRDLAYRKKDVYTDRAMAELAAKRRGGSWIYPVEADGVPLTSGSIGNNRIVGAYHVNKKGSAMPVAFPNLAEPAWAPTVKRLTTPFPENLKVPAGFKLDPAAKTLVPTGKASSEPVLGIEPKPVPAGTAQPAKPEYVPAKPTLVDGEDTWAGTIRHADDVKARAFPTNKDELYNPLEPSAQERALHTLITRWRNPRGGAMFVVAKTGLLEHLTNGRDLQYRGNDVEIFASLKAARKAAKQAGGAWIGAVKPDGTAAPSGTVPNRTLLGATYANADGRLMPVSFPNTSPEAWAPVRDQMTEPTSKRFFQRNPAGLAIDPQTKQLVPTLDAPEPTMVRGLDENGQPVAPKLGGQSTWRDVAKNIQPLIEQTAHANAKTPTAKTIEVPADGLAIREMFVAKPKKGENSGFMLVDGSVYDALYGGGELTISPHQVHQSYKSVTKAAERAGGSTIVRFELGAGNPLTKTQVLDRENILGATHVGPKGDELPFVVPNESSTPWASRFNEMTAPASKASGKKGMGLRFDKPSGLAVPDIPANKTFTGWDAALAGASPVVVLGTGVGIHHLVTSVAVPVIGTLTWGHANLIAFSYRAVSASYKAILKDQLRRGVVKLENPTLSNVQLQNRLTKLEDKLTGSGAWRRGIIGDDQVALRAAIDTLRDPGQAALHPFAREALLAGRGAILNGNATLTKIMDVARIGSFVLSGGKAWGAVEAGTFLTIPGVAGTFGNWMGIAPTTAKHWSRWTGHSFSSNLPTKLVLVSPGMSSAGDATTLGAMGILEVAKANPNWWLVGALVGPTKGLLGDVRDEYRSFNGKPELNNVAMRGLMPGQKDKLGLDYKSSEFGLLNTRFTGAPLIRLGAEGLTLASIMWSSYNPTSHP